MVVRFRAHPGALVAWVGVHSMVWTALGVVIGLVEFTESWKAMLLGGWIGLSHALLQWATTSVVVADGVLVSRNFGWVRRVPVDQIEVVHRVRHRGWSGVAVTLRGGDQVTLAAPLSSVLAPNPAFDEELTRLCASIAI